VKKKYKNKLKQNKSTDRESGSCKEEEEKTVRVVQRRCKGKHCVCWDAEVRRRSTLQWWRIVEEDT
jgi:hypothetical protein